MTQVEPSEMELLQSDASQSAQDNNDNVYPNLNNNPNANNHHANPQNVANNRNDDSPEIAEISRCQTMKTLLVYCVLISTFNLICNFYPVLQ